jgi:hypothetical protein
VIWLTVVGIVVTAIGVFIAWRQLRKREPLTSPQKIDLSQTHLAASGTANMPIAIHSEGDVVFNHPLSTPVQLPHKLIGPVQPERPRPNLVYAGSEQKQVYIGQWSFEGICDPHTEEQREHSVTGVVLKFENRPESDHTIGRAMHVIAKMRFLLPHELDERAIDYGVWLDSPCNSTDMNVGDTRELVLLCVVNDKLFTFRDKRTGNRDFGSEAFSYFIYAEIGNFDRVEVMIIDQHSQVSLSRRFKIQHKGTIFDIRELDPDE